MANRKSFDDIFPSLVDHLTNEGILKNTNIKNASDWFKQALEYNVPFGKKNRGMTVVDTYLILSKNPVHEDVHIAQIIGWCIEFLQAFFLVCDDIMDQSQTRRGKLCWYKKDEVGLEAVNDSLFLEQCIYFLLKDYVKPHKSMDVYVSLMELFHETTLQTIVGQSLDMLYSTKDRDFSKYTMQNYKTIVKWKTAYYSFYLPVACALYLVDVIEKEVHDAAKEILLQMGEYFQVQDDYLDFFGNPTVTGKIGTDIQECKCSWLVVTALELANDEQIATIKENYGKEPQENVAAIGQIFSDLCLDQKFKEYEQKSYEEIMNCVENLSCNLDKELFISLIRKIYKRKH